MITWLSGALCFAVLLCGVPASWAMEPGAQPAPDAEQLYKQYCQQCHEGQVARAPHREVMSRLPANLVLHSLSVGKMRMQGWVRTIAERRALSEWITGKKIKDTDETVGGFCEDAPGEFSVADGAPQWNGWGVDNTNSRFQSAENAGIPVDQVPQLKVKWVFGLPMDFRASQPTVVGGRVFVGSLQGRIYSLDAKTGCLYWSVKTDGGVRSTMVVDSLPGTNPPRYVVYVGDASANMYALDARTGKQLWKVDVDDHPLATITGTPKTLGNRLYVSTTALEELAGADPNYECCTFRGKMMALNRFNGKLVWRAYTLDAPQPTRKNAIGVQLWGPSGASIWSSPALDPERNRMYVTTGDNYSDPASLTSDAVVAFDLRTGEFLWAKQFTAGDAWNVGCEQTDDTNCPQARGPDLDFASSPILRILPDGRRVILAGQKSGVMHAIDPDRKGEILWQQRVGKGGLIGGIQWGSAADAKQVYVALSDIGVTTVPDSDIGFDTTLDSSVGGGMFAYDIETGERKWYIPPPGCGDRKQCSPAQSAAVSAMPGVVFSGSIDGHLRGYATNSGEVVWDYNADQEYESTNGVKTRGGSFDGPGPTIVAGMVYVNSGYGFQGGMGGNALIAFSVNGE
jgi:polyvinyl alcohol dehydrogenase (cytochrome)